MGDSGQLDSSSWIAPPKRRQRSRKKTMLRRRKRPHKPFFHYAAADVPPGFTLSGASRMTDPTQRFHDSVTSLRKKRSPLLFAALNRTTRSQRIVTGENDFRWISRMARLQKTPTAQTSATIAANPPQLGQQEANEGKHRIGTPVYRLRPGGEGQIAAVVPINTHTDCISTSPTKCRLFVRQAVSGEGRSTLKQLAIAGTVVTQLAPGRCGAGLPGFESQMQAAHLVALGILAIDAQSERLSIAQSTLDSAPSGYVRDSENPGKHSTSDRSGAWVYRN